jgi:hypothetical protein
MVWLSGPPVFVVVLFGMTGQYHAAISTSHHHNRSSFLSC